MKNQGSTAGAVSAGTGSGEVPQHTPGPWIAANMIHADRGDAMTADELGEYVANSVRKSIEDGGSAERFLFITTEGDGAPDICHVGNGPRGPANARLIAAAPDLLVSERRNLVVLENLHTYLAKHHDELPPFSLASLEVRIAATRAAIAKAQP